MRVIIQKYVRPIIIPSLLNLAGSASLLCAFHTQGNKVSLAANISQFGSPISLAILASRGTPSAKSNLRHRIGNGKLRRYGP